MSYCQLFIQFFMYITEPRLKSCLIWKLTVYFLKIGQYCLGGQNCLFSGLAVLVILVIIGKGVCPRLLSLLSLHYTEKKPPCLHNWTNFYLVNAHTHRADSSECMGKTFQPATTNTWELFDHRSLLQNIFLISAKLNFHQPLVCSTVHDI